MPTIPQIVGYCVILVSLLSGILLLAFRSAKTTSTVTFCVALALIGFACSYLPYLKEIHTNLFTIVMSEQAPQLIALEKRSAELKDEVSKKEKQLATITARTQTMEKEISRAHEDTTRVTQDREIFQLCLDVVLNSD